VESVVVRDGRGVTIRLILLLGVAITVVAYPALRFWDGRGHELPAGSWGGVIVLVFMACGVFFAGLPIRRFLRGQAKKPLNPLRAMRTLVLAQAAALTGALVAGWYLAQLLVLAPDLDVHSVRVVAVRLGALAAGGVLMSIAGLLTQAMCRVDKPDDGDQGESADFDGDQPNHHDNH
jgi:Na+/proline symporter